MFTHIHSLIIVLLLCFKILSEDITLHSIFQVTQSKDYQFVTLIGPDPCLNKYSVTVVLLYPFEILLENMT